MGVHEPLVHRVVIEVRTANGLLGLGECAGGQSRLENLAVGANAIKGLGVFDTSMMEQLIHEALAAQPLRPSKRLPSSGAFEVAALDIQGHATGRTVSELPGRHRPGRRSLQRLPVLQVGGASRTGRPACHHR